MKRLDELTEAEQAGLARVVGRLACLDRGHDDLEAFMDGDDVRFRCKRCKEVMYGGQ